MNAFKPFSLLTLFLCQCTATVENVFDSSKVAWLQLATVLRLRKSRNLTRGWDNNHISFCAMQRCYLKLCFLSDSTLEFYIHHQRRSDSAQPKGCGTSLSAASTSQPLSQTSQQQTASAETASVSTTPLPNPMPRLYIWRFQWNR